MKEPRRALLQLQSRIHRSLQSEVDETFGESPAAIRKYEQDYLKEFRGSVPSSSALDKGDLIEAIRAREVSFVADYHTFAQAQRTALRLIRDAWREDEVWAIGIEMVSTQDQASLDAFQAGKLSLKEFHSRIRYREAWGFPWKNYAPLFDWARKHSVRLIALNRTDTHSIKSDLQARDQWAAKVILDYFEGTKALERTKGQKARIIVLYGELHLAQCHLPNALIEESIARGRKAPRSLCIHQNIDSLYWRLAREGHEQETQILRLKRDSYCVFSSTPWAKLESLLQWSENVDERMFDGSIDERDDEHDPDDESVLDSLGHLSRYLSMLCGFFEVPKPDLDSVTLKEVQEADFPEHLESLPRGERKLLRDLIAANQRFFHPASKTLYLSSPTPNWLAELASVLLMRSTSLDNKIFYARDREDFFRRVLETAFGFLGSLVLNPRRKCDLAEDHARKLTILRAALRKSRRPAAQAELQARQAVLKLLKTRFSTNGRLPSRTSRLPRPRGPLADWMAADFLGRILGKKAHQALLDGRIRPAELSGVFLTPPPGDERRSWEARYARLDTAASPINVGSSKTDVI